MILLVLACSGGDPELARDRRALDAWREGRTLLESKRAGPALEAFQRAVAERPEDPVLGAWEASARASTGDLDGAIERIDGVLDSHPRFALGHYNRAAWLARSGRPDDAGVALALALELGAARDREAIADPDFRRWLQHPAFAFLPDEVLTVAVEAPVETAFWGSEVALRLRVLGTGGHDVLVVSETAHGALSLVGMSEAEHESSEGLARDLRYVFRVVGAGPAVLGPLTVTAGPWSATVPPVSFDSAAPAGKEGAASDVDLRPAGEIRGGWGCSPTCGPPTAPLVRRQGTGADVLTVAGARLEPPADLRYTFSREGRVVWQLWRYHTRPEVVSVRQGREPAVELRP